jgi:hypothetical protein
MQLRTGECSSQDVDGRLNRLPFRSPLRFQACWRFDDRHLFRRRLSGSQRWYITDAHVISPTWVGCRNERCVVWAGLRFGFSSPVSCRECRGKRACGAGARWKRRTRQAGLTRRTGSDGSAYCDERRLVCGSFGGRPPAVQAPFRLGRATARCGAVQGPRRCGSQSGHFPMAAASTRAVRQ